MSKAGVLAVVVAVGTLALVACSGSGGGACAECLEEKCSDLVSLCEADPSCACVAECMAEGGVPAVADCLGTCGLTERPPGFAQVEECVAVACPDDDECSTPSNWQPPDDSLTCAGSGAGIGGGALPDCGFDDQLAFDPDGSVLQLESSDKTVCARIERRDEGAGSLANTEWTLLSVSIGPLGQVAAIDGAGDMCWYSSHHNFRDWLHATSGTRHFDLMLAEAGHSGARRYELYVYEGGAVPSVCPSTADGEGCIEGPIELFGVEP